MKKILIGLFLGLTLSAYSQVDSILNVVDNKYERYTHYMESGNRRLAENELNMLIKSLYNIVAMMYDDQTSGGSNQEQFKSRIDAIYDAIFPFPIFSYDADVNYDSINIEIDTIALDSVYSESSNSGGLVHLGSSGRLDVTGDYYIDGGNLYLNNEIFCDDVHIDSNLYMEDTLYFGDGTYQTTAATGGGGGTLNLSGINNGAILRKLNDTIFGSDTLSYVNYNLNIAENKNILIRNLTNSVGGTRNVIIGDDAGADISNGSRNVIIGDSAGVSGATYYSVVIGEKAGGALTSGNWNTFIGKGAGASMVNGNLNTFIGFEAGTSMPSGNRNLFIGGNAGDDLGTVNDKLIIETQVFTVSNPPLIYGDFAADTLQINGDLKVTGYIEADSIVLINNTYSDIAFEDDYELMAIKDAVEYAYKNGNLKGMDRDGLTNPISYLNNLELKIEDLYLYTYSQQLEIERLRNLLVVMLIIISLSLVIALYKKN